MILAEWQPENFWDWLTYGEDVADELERLRKEAEKKKQRGG